MLYKFALLYICNILLKLKNKKKLIFVRLFNLINKILNTSIYYIIININMITRAKQDYHLNS